MRKNVGFTAYELVVTVAIFAVIAATAMPPYMKWWRTSRLQSAVSNFMVDLEMAKTQAIRENAFVVVELYAGNYKIFVDSNEDWAAGGENVLVNRELPPSVRIDTAKLSFPTVNDKVRFNSRGIPSEISTLQTIEINQANNNRRITVNRLGNINVQ